MCKSSKFLTALIMILSLSLLIAGCKKHTPTNPGDNRTTITAGTITTAFQKLGGNEFEVVVDTTTNTASVGFSNFTAGSGVSVLEVEAKDSKDTQAYTNALTTAIETELKKLPNYLPGTTVGTSNTTVQSSKTVIKSEYIQMSQNSTTDTAIAKIRVRISIADASNYKFDSDENIRNGGYTKDASGSVVVTITFKKKTETGGDTGTGGSTGGDTGTGGSTGGDTGTGGSTGGDTGTGGSTGGDTGTGGSTGGDTGTGGSTGGDTGTGGSTGGSTETTTKEITADAITTAFRGLGNQQFTQASFSISFNFSSINIGNNNVSGQRTTSNTTQPDYDALKNEIRAKLSGVTIEGATVSVDFTNTPKSWMPNKEPLTAVITITPQDGYTLSSNKIVINFIPMDSWFNWSYD